MDNNIPFLDYLNKYSSAITIIIAVIAGVYGFIKFRICFKDKRFNTYHRLIKELVQSDNDSKEMKLDRQIAVIFELRNFSEYYKVSGRILEGLKKDWSGKEGCGRIINEIDLTLSHIHKWYNKVIF